jgi:GH24 family phage-related lysozyme (muramidase)
MPKAEEEAGSLNFLPGIPGPNVFWGNDKGAGSYGALEMRRKIAAQLAGQKKGFPKNLGEGLTYLGESIGEAGMMARLEAMERARSGQLAEADKLLSGGDTTTAPPVAAAPPPAARTSEAVTEAPVVTASAPPVTTTEPVVTTPPATTTASSQDDANLMNNDPVAGAALKERYLAGRGIAPEETNVPLPPPLNSNPQAEAFRQRFLSSPRFNQFADPGAQRQGGEGTTAPIVPPTLERPPAPAQVAAPGPQAAARPQGVPPELSDWVAAKEGFRGRAFGDYGQTNIGYGTSARGRGAISEPEARAAMNAELEGHLQNIDALNPNLSPGARNALASLSFNTGGSWLRMGDKNPDGSPTLAGLVRAGAPPEALAAKFQEYNKAGGRILPGLSSRRAAEAQMFTADPSTATAAAPATTTTTAAAPTTVADGGYNFMDAGADFRKNWKMGGVNPKLLESVIAGGAALPEGYSIQPYSGFRKGDPGYHGTGKAIDIQIVGPDGPIPNTGPDKTGMYTRWARGAYTHALNNYPEIAGQMGWGGAFDKLKKSAGVSNVADLMHLDLGGDRGQLNPRNRLSVLGPLKDFNAPGAPTTQLAANPRDAIATTLATRQMQPTGGVGNLTGSQQFGTGESDAIREGDLPGGYGPGIQTAAFPPPPDTGTAVAANDPGSSDVAQAARMRDVVGLSRVGPRNPATASLGGRAGVMSDAPLPGLAPLPSKMDEGIAATIENRNKITDELLNRQNAPTAPVVPQPDPTQPGTELSPTEAPSSSPTISPASPRYAQANFADRFADVPPSGVLGPQGASPVRAPSETSIASAPPSAPVTAAPTAPAAASAKPPVVYEPLAKPLSPNDLELPPAANPYLMQRRPKPELPAETPKSDREILAEKLYRTSEDPEIQRRAALVAGELKAKRDNDYKRGIDAYKAEMQLYTHAEDRIEKWNADAEERNARLTELRNKIREQVYKRQQETPVPRDTAVPPGSYDPRLNTPASPQRQGPTVPPTPPGLTDKQWAEKWPAELVKATESYRKAAPAFDEMTRLIRMAHEHPGKATGVGALSGITNKIPGTDAYGFSKIIEQITGKNFLQAYDSLKGGGSITQIEGNKATAARARLETAQKPEDFNKALIDLENAVRGDFEQVQRNMRQPVTAWRKPGDNASYAPDIGYRKGEWEYIGGNPELPHSWRKASQ